jgi:hypothetical protein
LRSSGIWFENLERQESAYSGGKMKRFNLTVHSLVKPRMPARIQGRDEHAME